MDKNVRKVYQHVPDLNNETLEMDFKLLIASITAVEEVIDDEAISGFLRALVSKLENARINEFLNAKVERYLKASGKNVDADKMLRPKLKSYSLAANTYIHLYSKILKRRVWRLTLYYNSPEKIRFF